MNTSIVRPRVFVSSTIRDLADLRDALKFWLEEMAFDAQMSEHNDFQRRPEAGTFEACFESIRNADYYLVIIGVNRGRWYDQQNRISVTQQEYRTAREAFSRTGKPKILAFVRSDVMTVLRERRKLGMPEGNSLLEDWDFTNAFLWEVSQEEETHKATIGVSQEYPASNWVTPFSNFRELVTGLRGAMQIRGPLPRVAVEENLRQELEHNLRRTMTNRKGKPFYGHVWLDRLRQQVIVTEQDLTPPNKTIDLTYEQMKDIIIFVITGLAPPDGFLTVAMQEAIVSGALLDYDREINRFVVSPLLNALYQLREATDLYRRQYDLVQADANTWMAIWDLAKRTKRPVSVAGLQLLGLYSVHDSYHNVVRLTLAILRHLYGHTAGIEVPLKPISPIKTFEEEIEADRVTEELLQRWLRDDNLFLRIGTYDYTEEEQRQHEAVEKRLREILGDEQYEKLREQILEELLDQDTSDAQKAGPTLN